MKTITHQIANILKLKRRLIDAEMKKVGISRTGWQVLFWMRILGSCTQKTLLNNMDIDPGHLARVLEEFEGKKYIERHPSKEDRRCLCIELTEYSREHLMPHVESTIAKEDAVLFQGVDEKDKELLSALLSKLEQNLETPRGILS